jgi:hypothetical protein
MNSSKENIEVKHQININILDLDLAFILDFIKSKN